MRWITALFRSSVGKKVVMAVTGFIWLGFLVGHMAGNLKAFLGADHFDEYAHFLRVVGEPIIPPMGLLWAFRTLVLAAFLVHMLLAWQTSRTSWQARDVRYEAFEDLSFSASSRYMRWSGVVILLFVVYHVLHLTTGQVHPSFVEGAAYANLVTGLASPVVAGVYIVATLAVGVHLYHGLWSALQTLGAAHPNYAALRRPLAAIAALVLFLGFVTIPVSVLTGLLTL